MFLRTVPRLLKVASFMKIHHCPQQMMATPSASAGAKAVSQEPSAWYLVPAASP